jgi:hypothetical protein
MRVSCGFIELSARKWVWKILRVLVNINKYLILYLFSDSRPLSWSVVILVKVNKVLLLSEVTDIIFHFYVEAHFALSKITVIKCNEICF